MEFVELQVQSEELGNLRLSFERVVEGVQRDQWE